MVISRQVCGELRGRALLDLPRITVSVSAQTKVQTSISFTPACLLFREQGALFTEAFWRASVNNAPLYRALYAGLLFFIFDLRYASPLIYLSGGILASSLIHQGEPAREVPLLQRLPTVGLAEKYHFDGFYPFQSSAEG